MTVDEVRTKTSAALQMNAGLAARHPTIPFGGVKKSGYGLESGVEGLKAVAVPQVING